MNEKSTMDKRRLDFELDAKSPGIFRTMEELVSHASETIPPEQVILERADGAGLSLGEYLVNLNKICNMLIYLGVRKGENVAVFLPNCLEYSYFYLALGRLGVTVLPVNQFLKGEALSYVLTHCDIEYLITNKELFVNSILPVSDKVLERMKGLIFMDEEAPGAGSVPCALFSDFQKYPETYFQRWAVEGSDVAVIWLTSGTTGLPKGVVCTQEYLLHRVAFSTDYFKLAPSDVIYFILPMYHIPFYCWGVPMAMAAGCKLVFVDWFSASRFWEHASRYKASIVYTTGTIIPILLKRPVDEFEKEGRDRIRIWSAWPVDQPEVAFKRWPKTKFVSGYGLSEYALATMAKYNSERSEGAATSFTELKIRDPETNLELPTGKQGEIVLRSTLGPGFMMQGYYKSPEATEETIRDGWLHTGDGGYLDESGKLHFVDRLKDSVRVGGENVPSAQVEGIIASHPKVAEVAVAAAKGELGSDEMAAHVVLKEGEILSPEEFFQFCEEKMAYFMVPRYLRIRKELPKTANLKVQKYKLREEGVTDDYFRRTGSRQK